MHKYQLLTNTISINQTCWGQYLPGLKIMNLKWLVIDHCNTVQLKGNLLPAHMLQVEYCQVKIISYVQYLNGYPLHLCPHQANRWACACTNVALILNELFNETHNINSIYTINLRMLPLYQLILESIILLKSCSHAVSHALLFGQVWRMVLM